MLQCQGAQNIGLSSHKLKAALACTVWLQCTPVPDRQTDRQTDGGTNIMAIAWRFDSHHALKISETQSLTTEPKFHQRQPND